VEPAPKQQRFEPADRPVRFYEYILFVALDTAAFAAFIWPSRALAIITFIVAAVVLLVSLVRLLLPAPRFSLTRSSFAVISLFVFLLVSSLGVK